MYGNSLELSLYRSLLHEILQLNLVPVIWSLLDLKAYHHSLEAHSSKAVESSGNHLCRNSSWEQSLEVLLQLHLCELWRKISNEK